VGGGNGKDLITIQHRGDGREFDCPLFPSWSKTKKSHLPHPSQPQTPPPSLGGRRKGGGLKMFDQYIIIFIITHNILTI